MSTEKDCMRAAGGRAKRTFAIEAGETGGRRRARDILRVAFEALGSAVKL